MSLRARVLVLFLLLAATPLLALGGYEYDRSLRAVEALIAAQNARIADRVAEVIEARATRLESDVLLLSENAETQRWLEAVANGRPDEAAARGGRQFLDDVWSRVSGGYAGLQLSDSQGRTLYEAGRDGGRMPEGGSVDAIERPVRDLITEQRIGTLRLQPILEAMLPLDLISTGFGEEGFGMVVDRASGRVIYLPGPSGQSRDLATVLGAEVQPSRFEAAKGTFRYHRQDTLRVAAFASVSALPWTVVMSGAADEFAAPFANVGRSTLMLFVAVAALATLAFMTLLRRTTRSLEELTAAAAVVGQGDFSPRLPPETPDEVGRLTASFATMVRRIGAMMEEVRSSRQMAVLGEFAAQLSHEVRNPLTSIKLNLQKIEREAPAAAEGGPLARPLEIALREVGRLDGVVRGVLDLARQDNEAPAPTPLHVLAHEAVEVIAEQAARQEVAIDTSFEAPSDLVVVRPGRIRGAILNLLLNALDAMPDGGTVRIATSGENQRIALAVSDTGPGIPEAQLSEIFRPFATTKAGGTGLGLPLARRAIEEAGGTVAAEPSGQGARLVIRLRVHPA